MSVETAFSKYARVYDRTRKKFIPCFDDFYGVALGLLPDRPGVNMLDLGAGTGLMTAMVLERVPGAKVVLADISDAMLDQARARFEGNASALDFQVLDYTSRLPQGPFDAVVSALSIHHLDHGEKEALFRRIYAALSPGGIFINADQSMGATPKIDARYRKCWFEKVFEAGVTDEEMAGARERMKEDKMSTLSDQLAWMDAAGFAEVNCWYKWYNFVVYSGKKEDLP